jgi:hypothetical protein
LIGRVVNNPELAIKQGRKRPCDGAPIFGGCPEKDTGHVTLSGVSKPDLI